MVIKFIDKKFQIDLHTLIYNIIDKKNSLKLIYLHKHNQLQLKCVNNSNFFIQHINEMKHRYDNDLQHC